MKILRNIWDQAVDLLGEEIVVAGVVMWIVATVVFLVAVFA